MWLSPYSQRHPYKRCHDPLYDCFAAAAIVQRSPIQRAVNALGLHAPSSASGVCRPHFARLSPPPPFFPLRPRVPTSCPRKCPSCSGCFQCYARRKVGNPATGHQAPTRMKVSTSLLRWLWIYRSHFLHRLQRIAAHAKGQFGVPGLLPCVAASYGSGRAACWP